VTVADRIVRVVLRGEIGAFKAQMVAAGKSVADTADRMTAAGREGEKYRKNLSTIGKTAGGIGLAAAVGVGAVIAATANFDQAMSRVEAATHASASEMRNLRAAAIEAGKDTVFSATESADAITAMSKAGVEAKDILGGGLRGALALASAGELDVATAADIAATAMNQFGLQGKDIPHIADLLAAAAGKAQGEVTDMAASLKYVGPVAHQMGISIDETVGAIAELASQGILGEQAGTSLRGMLTALTSPSKVAAQEMKNLGIELYDANGQFVGLRGVAGQLGDTMGKLTNAERDQALGRIFGNEQITAARILYAGGAEAVDKWTKAVNDQGYAADTAAIKLDNLKGDLEQLKGSLETALIGAGSGSQNELRDITQGATNAVNAFNGLPPALQSTATGMLAITAITGGGLWFGSKVIRSVAETRAALEGLKIDAARTRATLSGLTKGIEFVAIIEGVKLLDKSLQSLLHQNLDTSQLAGDLQTLGETGQVTGTLAKTFGPDMAKFGKYAGEASSGVSKLTDKLYGFLPGDTTLDIAQRNIKSIDEALAGMVGSGNADQAAAIFDDLAAAADKQGVSTSRLAELMPTYTGSLLQGSGAARVMSDAMTGLIPATDGVTASTGPMGRAVQQSAVDLEAQAKALQKAREEAGETAGQFFGLGKSVNDSKVSLHGWIADLNKQTAALRDFTKNVQTAARRGLDQGLIASLEKAGPEGAMRLAQLADASKREIREANKAWQRGEAAIGHYVDVVGGVPPSVGTELELRGDEAALAAIRRIAREIKLIPKEWRTDYYVIQHNALNKGYQHGGKDGDPSTPYGDGGTVPGSRVPYRDGTLILAAGGEEIISNRYGEADRFRADRAAGRIPAYAGGGTVSASDMVARQVTVSAAAGGGAGLDYTRLGAAVAAAITGDRLTGFRDTRDAHLAALRTAFRETPVQRAPRDQLLMYGVLG
jgi:TP901 family phage tail tape measure protein